MKKSLFILPLAAMALASCDLSAIMGQITDLIPFWPKGDTTQSSSSSSSGSKSSSSSSKTSSSSSSKTSSSSSSSKTSSSSSSSQQPGEYTITLDFVTDYEALDNEQYVAQDTGLFEDNFGGQLAFTSMGCFVGSYSGSGYVMMQNQKSGTDWTTGRGGLAFFANTENFGSITRIEMSTGVNGATTTYDITLSKTPITSAQTGGTEVAGVNKQIVVGEVTASEDDGYGYFAISTKNKAKNGQVGKLVIEYTIS